MEIGSLIRRASRHHGDRVCLVEGDRRLTFHEFDQLTDRVGHALLERGLQAGDRVGVLLPNGIDCLIVYYALAKSGLVRVSLNTRDTEDDQRHKIADSGARAVFVGEGPRAFDIEFVFDHGDVADMMAAPDRGPCAVDRGLEAPYRLGYTGGTTGAPKAVTLTTRGELAEISAFLTDLVPNIGHEDVFLHAAPIAHASGAFFLPALVRGTTSVVMKKFDPAGFVHLAEQSRASYTFLVPTMLAMILDEPAAETADLAFTCIAYGAAPMPPTLLERATRRFGEVFAQTYGQAESPMVITCLKPGEHGRIGSCGRPFTCVDVAIFDDADNPLPPGEVGEIVCRGPQLMARYWNRPEATAKAFRSGWLHTGDVGKMDEDGFFYILDRKNDMLISGGYNVYPREVEDVLMAFDGVREAAVVGLPDETWGDRVVAVVAGAGELDADALLGFARSRLPGYKCPKAISVWSELPKSPANKIMRRTVRDRLISRQAEVVDGN